MESQQHQLILQYLQRKSPEFKYNLARTMIKKSSPDQMSPENMTDHQYAGILSQSIRKLYPTQKYQIMRLRKPLQRCHFCQGSIKYNFAYFCEDRCGKVNLNQTIGICCAILLYSLSRNIRSITEAQNKLANEKFILEKGFHQSREQRYHQMKSQLNISKAVDMIDNLIFIIKEEQEQTENLSKIIELRDQYCETRHLKEQNLKYIAKTMVQNSDKIPSYDPTVFQINYGKKTKYKVYRMTISEYEYGKFFMNEYQRRKYESTMSKTPEVQLKIKDIYAQKAQCKPSKRYPGTNNQCITQQQKSRQFGQKSAKNQLRVGTTLEKQKTKNN